MYRVLAAIGLVFAVLALAACTSPSAGPAPAPADKQVKVAGGAYTDVAPAGLKQMLANKDFFFVNVHIPYAGELAQTDAFIPYDKVSENLAKFPADKNAKIVLYCQSGRMSAIAAEKLVQLGYTRLYNLDGGMVAWETAGLPVIRK